MIFNLLKASMCHWRSWKINSDNLKESELSRGNGFTKTKSFTRTHRLPWILSYMDTCVYSAKFYCAVEKLNMYRNSLSLLFFHHKALTVLLKEKMSSNSSFDFHLFAIILIVLPKNVLICWSIFVFFLTPSNRE